MAKVQTPNTQTETPAPDLSILIEQLAAPLSIISDAENKTKSGFLDALIVIREYRETNPEVTRDEIKTAVQEAIAAMLNIKVAKVKCQKKDGGDDYAYNMVSQLLNTAWPKGEAEEKKVQKALDAGKGWVEVRKAASKAQKNRTPSDPDKHKITKETFATKLNLFLTKAQANMAVPLDEVLELADSAIEAIRKAPKA